MIVPRKNNFQISIVSLTEVDEPLPHERNEQQGDETKRKIRDEHRHRETPRAVPHPECKWPSLKCVDIEWLNPVAREARCFRRQTALYGIRPNHPPRDEHQHDRGG